MKATRPAPSSETDEKKLVENRFKNFFSNYKIASVTESHGKVIIKFSDERECEGFNTHLKNRPDLTFEITAVGRKEIELKYDDNFKNFFNITPTPIAPLLLTPSSAVATAATSLTQTTVTGLANAAPTLDRSPESATDHSLGAAASSENKEEKAAPKITAIPKDQCSDRGYLNHVEVIKNDRSLRKLKSGKFIWNDIPMLSVITGKNGVNKTTLLRIITQQLNNLYKVEDEKKIDNLLPRMTAGEAKAEIAPEADSEAVEKMTELLKLKTTSPTLPWVWAYSSNREFNDLLKEDYQRQFVHFLYDKLLLYYGQHLRKLPTTLENENLEKFFRNIITLVDKELKAHPEKISEDRERLRFHLEAQLYSPMFKYPTPEGYLKQLIEIKSITEINKFLSDEKFGYSISIDKHKDTNKLYFHPNDDKDTKITINELSPGETFKLHTLLWLCDERNSIAKQKGGICLLNEADANLHPEATRDMINTLIRILNKNDIQIVLITHNPTTVSMVPDKCLYVMREDKEKGLIIEPTRTKKTAIKLLTGNFVYVNQPFKFIFVEGSNDIDFYKCIKGHLQNRYLMDLSRLDIITHGRRDKDKDGKITENSDCALVKGFVEKLCHDNEDMSLSDHVYGIVDNDNIEEKPPENILRLEKRYSIENYLYDPIYVYFNLTRRESKTSALTEVINKINEALDKNSLGRLTTLDALFDLPKKAEIMQIIIDCFSAKITSFLQKTTADAFSEVLSQISEYKVFYSKDIKSLPKDKAIIITKENKAYIIEDTKLLKTAGGKSDFIRIDLAESKSLLEAKDQEVKLSDENINYFAKILLNFKVIKHGDIIYNLSLPRFKLLDEKNQIIDDKEIKEKEVKFIDGFVLQYPKILRRMKGHDLAKIYTELFFGGSEKGNTKNMLKFCERLMVLPQEFKAMFEVLKGEPVHKLERGRLINRDIEEVDLGVKGIDSVYFEESEAKIRKNIIRKREEKPYYGDNSIILFMKEGKLKACFIQKSEILFEKEEKIDIASAGATKRKEKSLITVNVDLPETTIASMNFSPGHIINPKGNKLLLSFIVQMVRSKKEYNFLQTKSAPENTALAKTPSAPSATSASTQAPLASALPGAAAGHSASLTTGRRMPKVEATSASVKTSSARETSVAERPKKSATAPKAEIKATDKNVPKAATGAGGPTAAAPRAPAKTVPKAATATAALSSAGVGAATSRLFYNVNGGHSGPNRTGTPRAATPAKSTHKAGTPKVAPAKARYKSKYSVI